MGRVPRIEFAGALYHVMSRGNRQDNIFLTDDDYPLFMDVLDEVCARTGWRVHAFVLMRNHYHFLIETPEPNLVDGMRWLQGTYTKRFNLRHKLWGHLFQGRYKALLIDPQQDYFKTVGNYIHLTLPARIALIRRANCFNISNGAAIRSICLKNCAPSGWMLTGFWEHMAWKTLFPVYPNLQNRPKQGRL